MRNPVRAADRRMAARDAVIAVEQKAVDHAYACYEARLAELTDNSVAHASASGKDSVANRLANEARADAYGGLGGEALVISRIDVREDPGPGTETLYVGRRAVSDVRTRDIVVVLWTSPLAKSWSDALPEAPGEVLLRRRLRCSERVVEDYHDDIDLLPATAPTAAPAADVPAQRTPAQPPRRAPAQPDDFLLRELQRSRGGLMRDIVETIRRDQMALVTGSPTDILVVQGGPGTGKSAVGLHRVTWMVDNKHVRAQDILVVGPHQHFLEYVGRVLPTLGTRDVNSVQLARM
ncbi:hypothetical protein [Streptomyces avicenniae]|uniref:hypothetical protein n=1 Tax=Streptomyces avicenniae TaxID=500153 RepID=UPI000A64AB76